MLDILFGPPRPPRPPERLSMRDHDEAGMWRPMQPLVPQQDDVQQSIVPNALANLAARLRGRHGR
jgi:hypothetical protein